MRKINKMDVLRLVLVLALVAGIGLAFGAVGRFVPTHKIVQPVYCGSCHPEQVKELSDTTHLGKFTNNVMTKTKNLGATASARTNARAISGGCVMCHNFWENMKWYGVQNFDFRSYDSDDPSLTDIHLNPPTDIYGNAVSPYGLGSTEQYVMNISLYNSTADVSAEPWLAGLDNYSYTNIISGSTVNHTRLDYVWSQLSAVSPGPVGFIKTDANGVKKSCGGGTVEHGMCHIAASAVALAYTDKKPEVSDYPNTNATSPATYYTGKGVFFTHEMAFTTAQYAAKPVKICGACHIMKLPPMQWGGEPWAVIDIKAASANNGTVPAGLDDPFDFRPTYNDLVGTAGTGMQYEENYKESVGESLAPKNFPVAFRTPDWAHANVPCIRCHAHAGINGETVSNNPLS